MEIRAADLRVGDLIKSFVAFVPHMRVLRAPLPHQGGVDFQSTHQIHYTQAHTTFTLTAPDPGWGAPYGGIRPAYFDGDQPVWLFRKGQRCRFYDDLGNQHGPEQANVAPAVAYAIHKGWSDARLLGFDVKGS